MCVCVCVYIYFPRNTTKFKRVVFSDGESWSGKKWSIVIKVAFHSMTQVVHYTIPHTFLYDLSILFKKYTLISLGTCFTLHAVAGPPPHSVSAF